MTYLILIACCVMGAAFFSGAETAMISASTIKLRHLASRGNKRAADIEQFLATPERILSVMLVGTNIFVVLGSILAATYTISLLDQRESLGMVVATIVMTPIMLIFGETLPKAFFYQHANWIVLRIVPILRLCSLVFYPVVQICSLPTQAITLIAGDRDEVKNPFVTREELKLLIMSGQSDLNIHEQEMISHMFRFSETVARSIMVPVDRVVAVDVRGTVADAIREIRESGHSRLPLYEGKIDNIVGYVAVQDILGVRPNLPLSRVRRSAIFVSEGKSISALLLQLKELGQHMAMVVNRNRKVSGLVTLEDVVEEIVGEIEDEYDLSPSRP